MGDNIVEIIIRAIDQASGVIDKIGKSGGDLEHKLVANWKAIGVAAAAAGAGIELLARKNNELLKETQQISIATGLSSKEINQLARDVAGAGDTIGETLDLIKLAGKEGLQSGEAIKKYAEYWDMVGDASGEVAGDLADASSGLRLFGIEADNVSDSADAFGHILNNTKTSLSDFLGILSKAGPSVSRFDIDINQMAIIVDELEEVGFTGKKAISAINDAAAGARNLPEFIANLERLTGAEINLNQSLDGSAEKLYAQAEAVDANLTPVQKLTAAWNEFAYQNAETIKTMSSLVPALASLGPALKSLKEVQGLLKDVNIASKLSGLSLAGMGTSALGLVGTLGLLGVALAPILAIMIATDYQEQKNAETIQKLTEVEKEQLYTMGEMSSGVTDLGGNYSEFGTLMVDTNEQILESYDEFGNVQRETGEQILELYDEFGRVIPENAEKVKQAYTEFGTQIEQVADDAKKNYDQMVKDLQDLNFSYEEAKEIAGDVFKTIGEDVENSAAQQEKALHSVAQMLVHKYGLAWEEAERIARESLARTIGDLENVKTLFGQYVGEMKDTVYQISGKNGGGVNYRWNKEKGIYEQVVETGPGQYETLEEYQKQQKAQTSNSFTESEWVGMSEAQKEEVRKKGSYTIGDNKYNATPDMGGDYQNDPDYEGFINEGSYSSGQQSPHGHDVRTERPDYMTTGTGQSGNQYYQGWYRDALADSGFNPQSMTKQLVEEWQKAGVELYKEVITNGVPTTGEKIPYESTDAAKEKTEADKESSEVLKNATSIIDRYNENSKTSSDSTDKHSASLLDLIAKHKESDAALGKSKGSLADWNTDVVGNTDAMTTETLGSVRGMRDGVQRDSAETTGRISRTWGDIGKESAEGTRGLGNDWKSFLQSARRDLQTEVQACSGPGCGFTGGGTGDGTGTGLEPVYDLEELWRRRGLPRAARGAKIVGAGDILVGEERPEVVRLPQGASVHPLSEYDGGFGGRAGNVYQITINTQGVIGDKSTARQFARWIMEALDFETIRRGTVA